MDVLLRWLSLVAGICLLAAGSDEGTDTGSCAAGGAGCGPSAEEKAAGAGAAFPTYPYPYRAGDPMRTGASVHNGPFPLQKPAWTFEVPLLNFHQTPAIDDKGNVYSGSDAGWVFAFSKTGEQKWAKPVGSRSAQNPALMNGTLYVGILDGEVVALNMEDGEEVWRSRVSKAQPPDTYSMTAVDDVVILPGEGIEPYGSLTVVVLERADGRVRWKYDVMGKRGSSTVNLAPCVYKGSILFNDVNGGVYRLSLKDGSEIWYKKGDRPDTYTLGGVSCGPGTAYVGFSTDRGKGALMALDIETGQERWRTAYPQEVHAAPAMGVLRKGGPLVAVVGVGSPSGHPRPPWEHINFKDKAKRLLGLEEVPSFSGTVVAVNAETGQTIWTFTPPPWNDFGCAGSTWEQVCLPDLWSGATIAADGTVYISWSAGGVTYALRDVNGDGRLEGADEISSYDLGSGSTGPPALADDFVLVATCRRLAAFRR